jgi:hypothetical protein
MNKYSFSKEPIAWIGATIVVLQTIQSYLQGGEIDTAMITNLLIVAGTIIGRQFVSPVDKENDEDPYA